MTTFRSIYFRRWVALVFLIAVLLVAVMASSAETPEEAVRRIRTGQHSAMPTPSTAPASGPAGKGMTIENGTGYTLHVHFSGPMSRTVVVPDRRSESVELAVGDYQVAAEVPGSKIVPFYGRQSYQPFTHYWLKFYTQRVDPPAQRPSPSSETQPKTQLAPIKAASLCKPSQPPPTNDPEYLPLAVGNTWTYRRTITSTPLSYRAFIIDQVKLAGTFENKQDVVGTVTTETYAVEKPGPGAGQWLIRVPSGQSRDGRYAEWPDQKRIDVIWTLSPLSPVAAESIQLTINRLTMQGRREDALMTDQLRPLALLAPGWDIKDERPKDEEGWLACSQLDEIAVVVPAGTFGPSLVTTVLYGVRNRSDVALGRATPNYRDKGYMTRSWYVKGLGLVKELQYSELGRITYSLELESYLVNR